MGLVRQDSRGRIIGAALGLMALIACPAPQAMAQGTTRATFNDWQLRCDTPHGASAEQCILYQNVADEQRPDVNIVVVVIKVSDPTSSDAQGQMARKTLLRVIAPLGVLLPRGLGLKIDDKEVGSTGFARCLTNGCVAEVELDQPLIEQLSKGKTATFIIFQSENEGRGLPLNLAGFAEGLAQLK
jgi:invasion protein IalB